MPELKPEITYDDFAKLDLRVATIKAAEEIPKAGKLLKLTIEVGELGMRTICAGIKKNYPISELIGKQIVVVANLAPREMFGIQSHGMLLAASNAIPTEQMPLRLLDPCGSVMTSIGLVKCPDLLPGSTVG